LRSSGLVDEIYKIASSQLEGEEKRDAILTGKATSLLGICGLSLTVAFSFGGILLQYPQHLAGLGQAGAGIAVIAFGLSLLLGLGGSFMALRGLQVIANFESVNESDVFNPDELSAIDGEWEAAYLAKADGDSADPEVVAVTRYKRFLTAHIWGIYQRTFDLLETKASRIAAAQKLYFSFIMLLILIGAAVSISAFQRIGAAPPRSVTEVRVTCDSPPRVGVASQSSSAASANGSPVDASATVVHDAGTASPMPDQSAPHLKQAP